MQAQLTSGLQQGVSYRRPALSIIGSAVEAALAARSTPSSTRPPIPSRITRGVSTDRARPRPAKETLLSKRGPSKSFPNSKAHLLPKSKASPLFSHRPILPRLRGDVVSQADGNAPVDRDFADVLHRMSQASNAGDIQATFGLAEDAARLLASRSFGGTVIATPFHLLLRALAKKGMIDTCWDVLRDMESSGAVISSTTLNIVLKAAITAEDEEAIDRTLDRFRALRPDAGAVTGAGGGSEPGPSRALRVDEYTDVLSYPVQNFTANTFNILFDYCNAARQPERALLLFAAAASQGDSPEQSFLQLFKPAAAENLINLLFECHEYHLALDIAEWLNAVGGERLIPASLWSVIARRSARADFHRGLNVAYGILRSSQQSASILPDEGFLLDALNTAANSADADLCLKLLNDYATGFFSGSKDAQPCLVTSEPYPDGALDLFGQAHLAPLVDACSIQGRFAEAIRLIGAIRNLWGKASDSESSDEALGSRLEYRAKKDLMTLEQCIQAWNSVLREAAAAAHQTRTDGGTEGKSVPSLGKSRRLSDLEQIDNVIAGARRVPLKYTADGKVDAAWMVDVVAMNSLIRAAARLGETDLALSVWEAAKARSPVAPDAGTKAAAGATTSSRVGRWLSVSTSRAAQARGLLGQRTSDSATASIPHQASVSVRPNVQTFNALLWACQTRRPFPAVQLGLSIFDELIALSNEEDSRGASQQAPALKPDALTYERLIVLLCSSSEPGMTTSQREADGHLKQAFTFLELCKEDPRLRPTENTYEALIRATRSREGGAAPTTGAVSRDGLPTSGQLIEEMLDAKHEMSAGLKLWLTQEID
ncbi:unnamed protein product [Parajaminaea phylloscopi]